MAVVPSPSVVTLVSALVPPTAPPKVVVPAVFTARLKAPLTVEANETFPEPVDRRGARGIGGYAGQRRRASDRSAERGRTGSVHRQAEGAVDRGGEANISAARAGERRIGPQRHGVVVGLRAGRGHGAAVDRG